MDNLLSNAIKYSPRSSTIHLHVSNHTTHAQIDIIDDGPGIQPSEAERIFDPFYQGKLARRGRVSGTGLGLAIVQRYVTLHNGQVTLEQSEEGAHFRVTLPLAKPHV